MDIDEYILEEINEIEKIIGEMKNDMQDALQLGSKNSENEIKKHEEILKETQLKIKKIKPSQRKKALKIKGAIRTLLIAGGLTFVCKAIGGGVPLYRDNITKYQITTTCMDDKGKIEKVYNEFKEIDEEYPQNYVCKYINRNGKSVGFQYYNDDLKKLTIDEIIEILSQDDIELLEYFEHVKEIEGIPESSEELNFNKGLKIIQKKVNKEKFIKEKESQILNLVNSCSWLTVILCWGLLMECGVIYRESDIVKLETKEQEEEELIRKLKLERDKRK